MIISCVIRLKQRGRSFGKTMIIDILRGSKNEKIKSFNFDSLSVWGLMKESKPHRIRTILDFLINEGTLEAEGDEYPVVVLGKNCEEVLKEERRIFIKLPKEQPKQKEEKYSSIKKPVSKTTESNENYDPDLFEKLKNLRRELASKEGVPAYIVFSDASLRDMCKRKPVSLVQFSAVNGVGTVKLEKYGEIFIKAILE